MSYTNYSLFFICNNTAILFKAYSHYLSVTLILKRNKRKNYMAFYTCLFLDKKKHMQEYTHVVYVPMNFNKYIDTILIYIIYTYINIKIKNSKTLRQNQFF